MKCGDVAVISLDIGLLIVDCIAPSKRPGEEL